MISLRLLSDNNRENFRTQDDSHSELKILSHHVSRLTQQQIGVKIQYTRLLCLYPSPKKIINAGFDEIIKIKRLTTQYALKIIKAAKSFIGTTSKAKEFELLQIIKQLRFFQEQLKTATEKIDNLTESLESVILAKVGNIYTFKNPNQL
jgi:hypothetical protein